MIALWDNASAGIQLPHYSRVKFIARHSFVPFNNIRCTTYACHHANLNLGVSRRSPPGAISPAITTGRPSTILWGIPASLSTRICAAGCRLRVRDMSWRSVSHITAPASTKSHAPQPTRLACLPRKVGPGWIGSRHERGDASSRSRCPPTVSLWDASIRGGCGGLASLLTYNLQIETYR